MKLFNFFKMFHCKNHLNIFKRGLVSNINLKQIAMQLDINLDVLFGRYDFFLHAYFPIFLGACPAQTLYFATH
jgi:hypothetical protein